MSNHASRKRRAWEIRENAKMCRVIEGLLQAYGSPKKIPFGVADEAMRPFGESPDFVFSMAEYLVEQEKKLH